ESQYIVDRRGMRWIGVLLIAIVVLLFAFSRQTEPVKSAVADTMQEAAAEPVEQSRKLASQELKPDKLDLKYKDVREGFVIRKKYLNLKDPE
ncbi:MAG: hypothetical protein ACXVBE_03920, partial [Bdellovibrionota bacterium]